MTTHTHNGAVYMSLFLESNLQQLWAFAILTASFFYSADIFAQQITTDGLDHRGQSQTRNKDLGHTGFP